MTEPARHAHAPRRRARDAGDDQGRRPRSFAAGKVLPEYWQRTDRWYNFTGNVRGVSHVIATVDEDTYTGGNTDGAASPERRPSGRLVQGLPGRPLLLHRASATPPRASASRTSARTSAARSQWAAGKADPVYSDCGATVLANYQQTKISAPPNLNEPIGFDQFPDGRIIQTARAGQVRLHDPAKGRRTVIANIPVYTQLARTASTARRVDNDFATNKWVYLYYAPPTVRIKQCDGTFKPT